MTMLCFFGQTVTPKNEEELQRYDRQGVQIHLFDQVLSGGITPGKVLSIAEQLQDHANEDMIFYTDVEALYHYVCCIFEKFFTQILLAGEKCCEEYRIAEYEGMIMTEGAERGDMVQLIGKLQALKYFMKENRGGESNTPQGDKYYNEINERFEDIYRIIDQAPPKRTASYWRFLEEYIEILQEGEWEFRIFVLSALLAEKKEAVYLENLCSEAMQSPESSLDRMFYIYQQLNRFCFENQMGSDCVEKLYNDIFAVWKEASADLLKPVPKKSRDRKKIVVIARQFLSLHHAPTRSALERIRVMGKEMDKEVVCFHSGEFLTRKGRMPFWHSQYGNVDESLNGMHRMEYREYEFSLYQPVCQMPDYEEMQRILLTIRTMKPYVIIVIGDHCLLGDLCAAMIPTICIPVVFTSLPLRRNQFIAVGRRLTEKDVQIIEKAGNQREQYIESVFSFQLKTQKTTRNREELGLPADRFVLAVVGTRLDSEINEEFLKAMEPLLSENVYIAFAGVLDCYEKLCVEFTFLKEHSTYVGYQEDILAFQEVCDLYVNPPRIGGGFSAVEAFYKRKPGVSLSYGDVATVMGSDFCVDNLQEMVEKIRYYKKNPDYYHEMAEKAYQRALVLLDGKAAMEHILSEAERREGFF